MKGYADLAALPEDVRITIIGEATVAGRGHVIGFIVDDDAKAERYLKKLQARYRIRVVSRGPGPGAGILVRIGPAES